MKYLEIVNYIVGEKIKIRILFGVGGFEIMRFGGGGGEGFSLFYWFFRG